METFILFTLKSSICLSAGFILYYVLLRGETFHRFKRFVLLGIIVFSLVIPLIKIQTDPTGISIPVQKLESTLKGESQVLASAEQTVQLTVQQGKPVRPINILLYVYLSGATLQLIFILISLIKTVRIIKGTTKTDFEGTPLFLSRSEIIPFCFGRRIIISEKDFKEHTQEIILHEKTHLKEGHFLDLLISEIVLTLTWYNPFSWLICHELKQNHEFEADRNVVRHGVDESDYQLLLVKTVAGENRFNLANQFNQSSIKTRITMMNKTKSNNGAILKALLFLPLVAIMLQVFAQKEVRHPNASTSDYTKAKYLILTPDQLKLLGFETNSTGLFYKNQRIDKPGRQTLCMFFTQKTYSGSMLLKAGETISGNDAKDRILKKQATTNFDYFPMIVAWFNGYWTLVNTPEPDPAQKLLPVQINMADLKTLNRTDTLVFWFNPTESLKRTLAPIVRVDDYLQVCPPDKRGTEAGEKK